MSAAKRDVIYIYIGSKDLCLNDLQECRERYSSNEQNVEERLMGGHKIQGYSKDVRIFCISDSLKEKKHLPHSRFHLGA